MVSDFLVPTVTSQPTCTEPIHALRTISMTIDQKRTTTGTLHIRWGFIRKHHFFVICLKNLSTYQPIYRFQNASNTHPPRGDVPKSIHRRRNVSLAIRNGIEIKHQRCTCRQAGPGCVIARSLLSVPGRTWAAPLTQGRRSMP